MIALILFVYIIGLIVLFLLGMEVLRDVTSFHVTVWLCWPVLILFGLVAVPFLIWDMIRTLIYKFRNWRIKVESHYDYDNY